jgi:hypothetical protein
MIFFVIGPISLKISRSPFRYTGPQKIVPVWVESDRRVVQSWFLLHRVAREKCSYKAHLGGWTPRRSPPTRCHGAPPSGFLTPTASCNGNPLIDGRGGRRRMRGSMDVVDAVRLQRNEVAIVGLKRECIIFGIDEHYSISWIGFLNRD